MIVGDPGSMVLRFAGDPLYHQCSIFLQSLGPIQAVSGGEQSFIVCWVFDELSG